MVLLHLLLSRRPGQLLHSGDVSIEISCKNLQVEQCTCQPAAQRMHYFSGYINRLELAQHRHTACCCIVATGWKDSVQLGHQPDRYIPTCSGVPADIEEKEVARYLPHYTRMHTLPVNDSKLLGAAVSICWLGRVASIAFATACQDRRLCPPQINALAPAGLVVYLVSQASSPPQVSVDPHLLPLTPAAGWPSMPLMREDPG